MTDKKTLEMRQALLHFAFPVVLRSDSATFEVAAGLSKREFFASMAMQGLNANPNLSNDSLEQTAIMAVEQADNLMRALGYK